MVGGMYDGGMSGGGACMAGRHVYQGACMAGAGVHGREVVWHTCPPGGQNS